MQGYGAGHAERSAAEEGNAQSQAGGEQEEAGGEREEGRGRSTGQSETF